jgi:hypothetical protein
VVFQDLVPECGIGTNISKELKKIEAGGSSEMLDPTYQAAYPCLPEACNLYMHCYENLKSHLSISYETTVGSRMLSSTYTPLFRNRV